MFQKLSECEYESFSRGFSLPYPKPPEPQLSFDFCFVKNTVPRLSLGYTTANIKFPIRTANTDSMFKKLSIIKKIIFLRRFSGISRGYKMEKLSRNGLRYSKYVLLFIVNLKVASKISKIQNQEMCNNTKN